MKKQDKLWFCRMNTDSVYPRLKFLLTPAMHGMPQKIEVSTLVHTKIDNETYVIPYIRTHVMNDFGSLTYMIHKLNAECELIKKEYRASKEDLTLKDLQ